MPNPPILSLLLLVLAPILGSFIGVVVDRLPRGDHLGGRSFCRSCGTQLTLADLVPLFSYMALKGKCRHCGAAIPSTLFLTEVLALLTALPLMVLTDPHDQLIGLILGMALLTLALIDRRHFWLPDSITLPLLVMGLALNSLEGAFSALNASIGAIVGYGLIWLLRAYYQRTRGLEAIGLGDAKLLAAIGAWLGWAALPAVLLIASTSGLITGLVGRSRHKNEDRTAEQDEEPFKIPFGLYLAIGFYGIWLAAKTPAIAGQLAHFVPVL